MGIPRPDKCRAKLARHFEYPPVREMPIPVLRNERWETRIGGMSVSVVVPTRDRPRKLVSCLGSLPGQGDEVVVVDDGSVERERVAAIVEEAGAKLVRLEGRGPAGARNAGVAAAGGEVVCFIDDDCEAEEGWVEALAGPIAAGEALAVGGRTVVAPDASAADRAWQAIANHLQATAAEPGSPSPGFAPTCNLACSRALLLELPFDESFPAAAGEDRDWAARAAARGSAPAFAPDAVVAHRPELTASSFLRQQYRYGQGATRFRVASPGRRLGSPSFYAGLVRSGFEAGPSVGALVCAAQLATAAGVLTERVGRQGGSAPRTGGYSKSRAN
jgi:GT2 family glycosyltransferase